MTYLMSNRKLLKGSILGKSFCGKIEILKPSPSPGVDGEYDIPKSRKGKF